jgi:putative endonuclease
MSRGPGEDRKRSLARLAGVDAERIAMLYLMGKGYWPLARDWRGRGGEIDIVMRRGRTVIAVEVKARPSLAEAASAITPAKIARIAAGMRQFRAERRLGDALDYRFDAVLISPGKWPLHVQNAGPLE